jgi:hypothetical protein
MISAGSVFAAMPDARPGRFYSVDELAALLRVQDQAELRERLRVMAATPDLHGSFKLVGGPSDEFYGRVSLVPTLTLCAAVGDEDRLDRLLASRTGKPPASRSGFPE